jgi:hypothetical protein
MFGHIIEEEKRKEAKRVALSTALDIRKFEIDLYWKRAAYFWVFIAASFAGFFWSLQQDKPSERTDNIMFLLTCIGLSASWAWCLVLRGSKYWQENWEKHVDYLEMDFIGNLYKMVRTGKDTNLKNKLSSYPYSVSKINTLLGYYVTLFWTFALIGEIYYLVVVRCDVSSTPSWFIKGASLLLSVSFIVFTIIDCKTKFAKEIMGTTNCDFISRDALEQIVNENGQSK